MTQGGQTALYLAAWSGHVATVTLLLKKDADPNICDMVNFYILNCLNLYFDRSENVNKK